VLSRLSELDGTFLTGNHDRSVLATAPESPPSDPCEFEPWTSAQLSESNRRFLESFVEERRVEASDPPLCLHHGDFAFERDDLAWNGRGWPDTDREVYREPAARYDEPLVLFGHSHAQFETQVDGTRFVNPGSVGQHRLGTVKACYAVLEDGQVRLDATGYDVDRTIADLEALPLHEEYIEGRKRVYTDGSRRRCVISIRCASRDTGEILPAVTGVASHAPTESVRERAFTTRRVDGSVTLPVRRSADRIGNQFR